MLLSEVMLQQTQVSRVLPAYRSFLKRYPTLRALAHAPLGEVLRAWSGLGYNRRARDLWRSARLHPRSLPRDVAHLDALPGIGAYTAGAVACFAYGARVPFADTNIRRVLGRVLLGRVASDREARDLDAALLPRRNADRWHHALMDLGATVCVSRSPRCTACPVATICRARAAGGAIPRATMRPQRAFATSDRRRRGRIIAALANAPAGLTVRTLARRIDRRAVDLVAKLEHEGLLEVRSGRARLPE